jgi:hypothetical protein
LQFRINIRHIIIYIILNLVKISPAVIGVTKLILVALVEFGTLNALGDGFGVSPALSNFNFHFYNLSGIFQESSTFQALSAQIISVFIKVRYYFISEIMSS